MSNSNNYVPNWGGGQNQNRRAGRVGGVWQNQNSGQGLGGGQTNQNFGPSRVEGQQNQNSGQAYGEGYLNQNSGQGYGGAIVRNQNFGRGGQRTNQESSSQVARPKVSPIRVLANYFPLNLNSSNKDPVYYYNVQLGGGTPDDLARIKRRAMYCLIEWCFPHMPVATDFVGVLITRGPLTLSPQPSPGNSPQASPRKASLAKASSAKSSSAKSSSAKSSSAKSSSAKSSPAKSSPIEPHVAGTNGGPHPMTGPVPFPYWKEDSVRPLDLTSARETFTATITQHTTIDLNFQRLANLIGRARDDAIRALNFMFSRRPHMYAVRQLGTIPTVTCVGSNRFYNLGREAQSEELGAGLIAYRGVARSIHLTSSKQALNVSLTTGAFYCEGSLNDTVESWMEVNQSSTWPNERLSEFLRGLRIRTNHLKPKSGFGHNQRIFTIRSIARRANLISPNTSSPHKPDAANIFFSWDKHPEGTRRVSVWEYYNTVYPGANATKDCLVVDCGSANRAIYFPVTVCDVLAGQFFKKGLSSPQTAAMVAFAEIRPDNYQTDLIQTGLRLLGISPPDPTHGPNASMGVTTGTSMINIKANLFEPPPLMYSTTSGSPIVDYNRMKKGVWNLDDRKFTIPMPAKITNFTFLQLVPPGRNPITHEIMLQSAEDLQSAMDTLGMSEMRALPTFENQGRKTDYFMQLLNKNQFTGRLEEWERRNEANIQNAFQKILSIHPTAELIVVALPDKNADVYAMVKRIGDVTLGIRTVCAVSKYDKKHKYFGIRCDAQYLANVAMKINLKFGGANQWLGVTASNAGILAKSTMFVGVDVTHSTRGGADGIDGGVPSIAAVVATQDATHYAQWRASVQSQETLKGNDSIELVVDLKGMLVERLNHWKAINKSLPEQIFVYRDGGSEGFFPTLEVDEWISIQGAIANCYGPDPASRPKTVLICALKRNSTRFFPADKNPALVGTNSNCRGGLFVDSQVVLPDREDFFLQSHDSIKGTAKPIHYVILKNEVGASVIEIAALTHDFCHLQGRATRTVSVHPAVFYADLVCDRARIYWQRVYSPHPNTTFQAAQWGPATMTAHGNLRDSMYFV